MKIEYEKGDSVFTISDFGGEVLKILRTRKTGVVVEDRFGQTSFHPYTQVCPTFYQLSKAKYAVNNNG